MQTRTRECVLGGKVVEATKCPTGQTTIQERCGYFPCPGTYNENEDSDFQLIIVQLQLGVRGVR